MINLEIKPWFERSIKYRGYDSPKGYYLDHPKLHHLTRYELSLRDAGLYKSLIRWRQLSVVPERKRGRPKGRKDKKKRKQRIYGKHSLLSS